jgi:hypothetical protein
MRYIEHDDTTYAAFLPDTLANAEKPTKGWTELLPLRVWRDQIARLPDLGPVPVGALEGDEPSKARVACLEALRAEGAAPGFRFRADRDPALQHGLWLAQITREYLDDAGEIVSVLREVVEGDVTDAMLSDMATAALAGGVTEPGKHRGTYPAQRAEEKAKRDAAAKAAREYREHLAKPCTFTADHMGELGGKDVAPVFAVAVDELIASPKDPVAVQYLVSEWQGLKPFEYRLRDGKRILFFGRERFILGTYEGVEIAKGVTLLPSDYPFTATEEERRSCCKSIGQRVPDEIARHVRAQRAKQIDHRPMTDAETTSNPATVEQWIEFSAPHLKLILPLSYSQDWPGPNGITASFVFDYGVRGLKLDVIAAHDALIRRLRTHVRCSGTPITSYKPSGWDAVSVMVAAALERSFAGGSGVSVSPGEIEGPGALVRVGASIKGLFARKPKVERDAPAIEVES